MPDLRHQLAQGLLHLRNMAGLSLGQLAKTTGFSRPALNHLERGLSGGVLDSADAYAAGCHGRLVVVAVPRGEEERALLAEAAAQLPLSDLRVLLRLIDARPDLPDHEWRLLADATELRVRALKAVEHEAAEVVRLRR